VFFTFCFMQHFYDYYSYHKRCVLVLACSVWKLCTYDTSVSHICVVCFFWFARKFVAALIELYVWKRVPSVTWTCCSLHSFIQTSLVIAPPPPPECVQFLLTRWHWWAGFSWSEINRILMHGEVLLSAENCRIPLSSGAPLWTPLRDSQWAPNLCGESCSEQGRVL